MPGKNYLNQLEVGFVQPLTFVGGVIVVPLNPNIRFVTFTLAGIASATGVLPPMSEFAPGQIVLVARADADGLSTAIIAAAAGDSIMGGPSILIPVTSGFVLAHNTVEWRILGTFP